MRARRDIHAVVLGALAMAVIVIALAGCSASQATSTTGSPPTQAQGAPTVASTMPTATTSGAPAAGSPGGPAARALTAEADSAAAGDIPDNQVFLTFRDSAVPYTMQYPEGWAQSGSGGDVTFKDKNNIVRVTVGKGSLPTVQQVQAQMTGLTGSTSSLHSGTPHAVTIHGAPAVKVTYTTKSAPSPVTGKSVTLAVDRYYLAHGGRAATVDLGTPQGVDNVDAFRQMIESFRWQ